MGRRSPGADSGLGPPLALVTTLGLALAGYVAPCPAAGEGFAFYPQGGKAAGLAGAFVAQADDPTALFYNPGGLALLKKKKAGALGVTVYRLNEALYQGLPPGIGAGTTGEQTTPFHFPAHVYAVLPLGARLVAGVGAYSPFLLSTRWENEGTYAGRYLALHSRIESYDLAPTLSWAATPNLGIGVGLVYRSSEISILRRYPILNPFTGQLVDAASLTSDTDLEAGFGWSAGLLHRVGSRFAYGVAFRSAIATDYNGVGRATQIPTGNDQLDALVAATLPLGQEVGMTSRLEFPEVLTAGVALGLAKFAVLELDVQRTGWKSFAELAFDFPADPVLDHRFQPRFEESMSYRAGLLLRTATGSEFRFGYAFEESPQPDEGVGALLADADRNVLAAGFGRDWLDVAFSWTTHEQRIVAGSAEELNGNYRATSWLLALTLKK